MFSKIITVLFAVNCIAAVNGFIDSKLRVLEPILKCHEANTPEFEGEKTMAARINLDSETDLLKLSCLAIEVNSQTKLTSDKLTQGIFRACLQGGRVTLALAHSSFFLRRVSKVVRVTRVGGLTFSLVNTLCRVNKTTRINFLMFSRPYECTPL